MIRQSPGTPAVGSQTVAGPADTARIAAAIRFMTAGESCSANDAAAMLVYAAVRTGRDLPQLADDVAEAADLAQRCQLIGPAVVEHSPRSPIRTTPRYPTWSTREN